MEIGRFPKKIKKYYEKFFGFLLSHPVLVHMLMVGFWVLSDFELIGFIKSKFCENISVGRTSDRILHEEHKPILIIYGHEVYQFDRIRYKNTAYILIRL